jgi:hypothetical protein
MEAEICPKRLCWAQPPIQFIGEVNTGVLAEELRCLDLILFG